MELELRRWRGRALLSAICKCIVEPVSWSSSEVLLPSRCLHRAATALETCSSDSLDPAAAFAGDFAFFEPLLGAGGLAFLELLGGAAAGGAFAFLALVGAAAFAFFALGTGAEAAGVAAVSATLRFFGFSAGVGVAVAGSLTSFHFVGLSAFAGTGLLGIASDGPWKLKVALERMRAECGARHRCGARAGERMRATRAAAKCQNASSSAAAAACGRRIARAAMRRPHAAATRPMRRPLFYASAAASPTDGRRLGPGRRPLEAGGRLGDAAAACPTLVRRPTLVSTPSSVTDPKSCNT